MGTLSARALELLQLAHAQPGLTRARAATLLGASSGTVTGLVNGLVAAQLLDEQPAPPTGNRGRPTRTLVPHPKGPLVLGAVVTHEAWRLSAVQLTGDVLATLAGVHPGGDGQSMVIGLRDAAARMSRRFRRRIRGMGVALPGVVRDTCVVDAPLLGWRDVDLRPVWVGPAAGSRRAALPPLLVAGNDATFAAVAEARRGAAAGGGLHLHLHLDAGLGGAMTLNGLVVGGAQGLGGEFGHMPFGDPATECPCGAFACWTTAVGALALARALGEPLRQDAVTHAHDLLDRAAAGDPVARGAVAGPSTCLGRGIAGLVNGLDPDLVTLGGLAPRLVEVMPAEFERALRNGLMRFRRSAPPPVRSAELGEDAPLIGAAEQVWTQLWDRL